MHCEPLTEHLAHIGRSLLHLTFEAAQASQEARSLGLRSLSEVDLGAEVGDLMVGVVMAGVDVGLSRTIGECHCAGCVIEDIMIAEEVDNVSGQAYTRLSSS